MMTSERTTFTRWILAAAVATALTACSSAVTRESSPVSTPKYGATRVVQRGDTLYRIGAEQGIAMRDLAAWNGIGAPYTIYPGQQIFLYPKSGGVVGTRSPATGRAPAAAARAPVAASPSAAPIASGIAWRWPVDGALLSRYVAGEPTKQGIDIAGVAGSAVRAAGDGTVVYSGSGLVGYGELVIIKHSEQWLSAYGHNRSRMVEEGAKVKAGQQIAELGRTGASRDMLHFEIRYNGKPVDPLLYLPKK